MNRMWISTGVLAVIFSMSLPVSPLLAELISVDDPIYGLGSITRDTDTGLDWLDVTVTVGRSYNDIFSALGSGGEFEGWRFATVSNIVDLLGNAGVPTHSTTPGDPDVLPLINQLGVSGYLHGLHPVSQGFFNDDGYGTVLDKPGHFSLLFWTTTDRTEIAVTPDWRDGGFSQPGSGSLLIRETMATPVPSSLCMLGMGSLGIFFSLARKQYVLANPKAISSSS